MNDLIDSRAVKVVEISGLFLNCYLGSNPYKAQFFFHIVFHKGFCRCMLLLILKPEDQWSCKRSPDILA